MKHTNGSALLLTISMMTITLIIIATMWRGSVFVYELGLARQEYEQQYWEAFAFMNWSLALCKENFDHFLNFTHHAPQTITIKKWPPVRKNVNEKSGIKTDKKNFGGVIVMSKKESNQIEIESMIKKQIKNLAFKCILSRENDKNGAKIFMIKNWSLT